MNKIKIFSIDRNPDFVKNIVKQYYKFFEPSSVVIDNGSSTFAYMSILKCICN